MNQQLNIGIIGDFNEESPSHHATNAAIEHAARRLGVNADVTWLPTPSFLVEAGQKQLVQFDGIWASPGSPYQSMEGALRGIKTAREMYRPFIGT